MEYSDLSYQAYRGSGPRSIWWVDDCFYNRSESGCYLPMDAIKAGRVDPLVYDGQGMAYLGLRDIAEREKLNLWVCSFEYAEAHWDLLNVPGNIVLLSVAYMDVDLVYGVRLYTRLAMTGPVLAECAYFTFDPCQVASVQKAWRLEKLPNLEKGPFVEWERDLTALIRGKGIRGE